MYGIQTCPALASGCPCGGDAVSLEIGGPRSPDSPEQPRRRGVPPTGLGLPIRAWQQAFVLGVDELARLCNEKKAFFPGIGPVDFAAKSTRVGHLGKDQGREARVFLRPAGPRRLLNITRRATATVMGVGYGYGGRRSGGGYPRNSGTRQQQVRGCLSGDPVFPNSAPVPSASGQINNDQRTRMGQTSMSTQEPRKTRARWWCFSASLARAADAEKRW